MKKADIIAKLKELNIEHDPEALKPELEALLPEEHKTDEAGEDDEEGEDKEGDEGDEAGKTDEKPETPATSTLPAANGKFQVVKVEGGYQVMNPVGQLVTPVNEVEAEASNFALQSNIKIGIRG